MNRRSISSESYNHKKENDAFNNISRIKSSKNPILLIQKNNNPQYNTHYQNINDNSQITDENETQIAPIIMKDDLWKRHNHVEPKVNIINIQSTTRNLKLSQNKSSTMSRNSYNSTPSGILSMMRNKSSPELSMLRNTKQSVGFDQLDTSCHSRSNSRANFESIGKISPNEFQKNLNQNLTNSNKSLNNNSDNSKTKILNNPNLIKYNELLKNKSLFQKSNNHSSAISLNSTKSNFYKSTDKSTSISNSDFNRTVYKSSMLHTDNKLIRNYSEGDKIHNNPQKKELRVNHLSNLENLTTNNQLTNNTDNDGKYYLANFTNFHKSQLKRVYGRMKQSGDPIDFIDELDNIQ